MEIEDIIQYIINNNVNPNVLRSMLEELTASPSEEEIVPDH